ncbi:hypothetical protein P8C59_005710 [Phyllachora maydis]|nr:hypothetical protein P8C59_005710 [Phyllachora maydis]
MFQWSAYLFEDEDKKIPAQYPSHLATGHIPKDQSFTPFGIFSATGILATKKWLVDKSRVVAFADGGYPGAGLTIEDVVAYNKHHRKTGIDISNGGNIGLLDDWYGDRRFADQSLSGTNPTSLTVVLSRWIGEFVQAAKANQEEQWEKALAAADAQALFVQDNSYIRETIGIKDPAAIISTLVPQIIQDIVGLGPDQCHAFIRHHFEHFDWVGNYVPNDLALRGFANTAEGLKSARYRHYPYARNMLAL